MRKILYRISAFAAAVCIFLANGQFAAVFSEQIFPSLKPDTYVIFEDNFENGLDNWHPLGGQATLSEDSRYSKKGSYSLNVKDRANTWSGPYLSLTGMLEPGETYTFHAFVHHMEHGKTEKINLILQYENSAHETDYIPIESVDANVGWNLIDKVVTMPSDFVSAGIYFEATNLDLSFNIDNILISGSKESAPVSENEYGRKEYSYGFEEGFETWKSRGGSSVETSRNFSYTGSYSLYISERKKSWHSVQTEISSIVEKGVPYRYSAYVMYNGKPYGEEHDFQLNIEYAAGGEVHYPVICSKTIQKKNWSRLEGEFTIPENASDIYLFISPKFVEDEDTTAEDLLPFYIDNVSIEDNTIIIEQRIKATWTKAFILLGIFAAASVITVLVVRALSANNSAVDTAARDTMTDTFNRNSYEFQMLRLSNCPDDCKKIWITVCDLNSLKQINDNYGHQKGDDAIIRCASVLLRTIGKKGEVYRTGGDEFVCITRRDMTEKLRQAFRVEAQQYKGYPFAAAVGTSTYLPDEDGPVPDIKIISARSDKDMYRDKEEIKKNMM